MPLLISNLSHDQGKYFQSFPPNFGRTSCSPANMDSELISKLSSLGLDDNKAKETAKNKKLSLAISSLMDETNFSGNDRHTGLLLYSLAASCTSPDALKHRLFVGKKIVKGDLTSESQVQAAIRYVERLSGDLHESTFDMECGVGVVVAPEIVNRYVKEAISKYKNDLLEDRYSFNTGNLLKYLRDIPELRWADRKLVKETLDSEIEELLGPKTEDDSKKKRPIFSSSPLPSPIGAATRTFEGEVLKLHKPGENKQLNDKIMQKHLAATGGRVVTRFPPEPNGFLHIGHAKAINFSFRYAEAHNGICYLRYDDTNPEAEKDLYYKSIKETVEWLGFEPNEVTAASDYFQQLYEYAVELIRRGKAYVCHLSPEEVNASRGGKDHSGTRFESPWRNRPIEESLKEFERMKNGEYKEGEATLRLKMDMNSSNPCLWDLVAYRVMYTPHCRTGRQWNIYPMYDYTHCLCDSIENITHSLCTTEFINAREAYYWVCDALEVYKAVQWEYGRLNITNTVLSKRKLTKLVEEKIVDGWDDPRVYTLAGIRRRGFPPVAINRFVEELGITTAASVVDVRKLESVVRDELNRITHRRMAVLEPLLVKITNIPEKIEWITIPNDPRDPSKGESQIPFCSQAFIDYGDFRLEYDEEYKRFAPDQPVGLFKIGVLTYERHETDGSGRITCIYAKLDRSDDAAKPKTFVQWVANAPSSVGSPIKAVVRIYSTLFNSINPDEAPGGFLKDINPNSLREINDALVDLRLSDAQVEDKFQFQRLGYFCKDRDSTKERPVFNLTVSIKEDPHKS